MTETEITRKRITILFVTLLLSGFILFISFWIWQSSVNKQLRDLQTNRQSAVHYFDVSYDDDLVVCPGDIVKFTWSLHVDWPNPQHEGSSYVGVVVSTFDTWCIKDGRCRGELTTNIENRAVQVPTLLENMSGSKTVPESPDFKPGAEITYKHVGFTSDSNFASIYVIPMTIGEECN